MTASTAAQACLRPGPGPNLYAEDQDPTVTQNTGLFSNIYVASSGVADCASGGHVNETIWEGVDNQSYPGSYWVEAGWTHGYKGDCGLYFYWARNTGANGYADHEVNNATPSLNTYEPVQVSNDSNDTWNVYFNYVKATGTGGAVANITAGNYGRWYNFGLEYTNSASMSHSTSASDLQYRNDNGSWTSKIDAGGTLYCDVNSYTYWVTTDVKLRSCLSTSC